MRCSPPRFLLPMLMLLLVAWPSQAQREFGFDNRKSSGQPYLKPEETVAKMKVPPEFEVKLFAGEPQLVNPIAMTVDEKGRVWVIECFEYPKRTPKGKMPRDRIVILEDTDGDGTCDKRTVFAEGKDFPVSFDMASGIEVGYGGVFVGAPPYLFFIENKNDKPGKFEILLKGFGSQDTHETLNTFQWGPDGWLYGLHGVFTHSEVKPEQADGPGTRLNAAIWRFHPKTKKFEIFAEGTSNPWGMDWRNTDGQFILCCCVIPHLYHIVPGASYKRQAGQSFNPHVYGYVNEICDHTFHKESGWAHAGLISLDVPHMPAKYRNSVIFGSIHGCMIKQNILKPNGSSFIASRGDNFLESGDKNFRPINLRWGPNGEIYCIDWHDQNPCHQAAPDSWDYERGRVYRIQLKGTKTRKPEDLASKNTAALVQALADNNPYVVRTAQRLLIERAGQLSGEEFVLLKERALVGGDAHPLAALLRYDSEGRKQLPNVDLLREFLLKHPKAGDAFKVAVVRQYSDSATDVAADAYIAVFVELLRTNPSPALRRELASAAVRLAEKHDVGKLIRALMAHKEDAKDPLIPHLTWLAYEKHLQKTIKAELGWLKENAPGNPLILETILPRTMRRLAATGKAEVLGECLGFVTEAKDPAVRRAALEGLATALDKQTIDAPPQWKTLLASIDANGDPEILKQINRLRVSFRDREASERALLTTRDGSKPLVERIEAIRALALLRPKEGAPLLLRLCNSEEALPLRQEAIRSLGSFDDATIPGELLREWASLHPSLRNEAVQILSGRKDWARALMQAVADKKVSRTELTDNTIERMQAIKDRELASLIEKHWGRVRPSPEQLKMVIDKMRNALYTAPASFARGKQVFANHCAKCHKFDAVGHDVGPNLDGAGRDIEYLLTNVLDPNRVIGAPYFMRTITLQNGKVETGVLHAEDERTITLKTENAVLKVIPKNDIETNRVQEKSLMPEGLGYNMTTQDFRDLVRYVMAHPFITVADLTAMPTGPQAFVKKEKVSVGLPGRILIPDGDEWDVIIRTTVTASEALKTRLLLGIRNDFEVRLNEQRIKGKGSGMAALPDQVAIDVALQKGENTLEVRFRSKGKGEAFYARFLDPDRKLSYPDVSK